MLLLIIPAFILICIICFSPDREQEAREEARRLAAEEAAKQAAKRAAKQAAKQAIEEYCAKRVPYFRSSPLLPDIIRFLRQNGIPYRIKIHTFEVCIIATPPHYRMFSVYRFQDHFIEDIPAKDLYPLGCAINDSLDNRFTVTYDGYNEVTLTRPLPELRKF